MGFKKRTRERQEKFAKEMLDKAIESEDFDVFPTTGAESGLPPNLAEDTDYEPLIVLGLDEYPWLETHVEAHYIRTTEPDENRPGVRLYTYPLHEWMKFMEEEE